MLLDVGLQHCVEVLELSVSDEAYDVYLTDTREYQRLLGIFITGDVHKEGINSSDIYLFGETRTGRQDARLNIIVHRQFVKKPSCMSWQGHWVTHTCRAKSRTYAYQCVKHKDVIVVSLRVFHHDVEQGIQSVLQKLHQEKRGVQLDSPFVSLDPSGTRFLFTLLTLTTSSPSIILSFSRFPLRSSGRVLHLSSPSKPTTEDRHTEPFLLKLFPRLWFFTW